MLQELCAVKVVVLKVRTFDGLVKKPEHTHRHSVYPVALALVTMAAGGFLQGHQLLVIIF
jgi:hypothetical protein